MDMRTAIGMIGGYYSVNGVDQRGYLLYMEVIINEQSTDIKSVRRHKSVTKQFNGRIKGNIIIQQ